MHYWLRPAYSHMDTYAYVLRLKLYRKAADVTRLESTSTLLALVRLFLISEKCYAFGLESFCVTQVYNSWNCSMRTQIFWTRRNTEGHPDLSQAVDQAE